MDRREYQRKYMREWRAKRRTAPTSWTVHRTGTWLRSMADYAYANGMAHDGSRLDDAVVAVLNFAVTLEKRGKLSDNAEISQNSSEND